MKTVQRLLAEQETNMTRKRIKTIAITLIIILTIWWVVTGILGASSAF